MFKLGDWTGARIAFQRAVELAPDFAVRDDIDFLIGVTYMESGDNKAATDIFTAIAAGNSRWRHQATYRLAWLSFSNGDMEEAYGLFNELSAVPGELAAYCTYWQAECLLRLGNEPGGIEQFKYLMEEMPDSPMTDNALFRCAKIMIGKGSGEEGAANLEYLIERYKDSELVDDSAYLIARIYLDGNQYDLAIGELDYFISSYPASPYLPRAHFDKGMAYCATDNYGKAITVFEGIIAKYPKSDIADDAFYQLGICKFEDRDYRGALSVFNNFGDIYPVSPLVDEAGYQTEVCRFKLGEYKSEEEMAQAYIARYPESSLSSGLYIVLARHYDKKGVSGKAEKYYLMAEDTADSSESRYKARKPLADHYLETGQFDKAISVLGRIADETNGPGRESALHRMAEISEDIGDDAKALSYYSRVINEFPDGEYRSSALLRSGNRLRKLKMYEESNATLMQFIDEYPHSKNINVARFYIAFNFQRMGDYGAAIKYHKSVATYGRRSLAVQSYYWLGICERDLGNAEAARSYFNKIANNYRDFPDWVKRAETELNSF